MRLRCVSTAATRLPLKGGRGNLCGETYDCEDSGGKHQTKTLSVASDSKPKKLLIQPFCVCTTGHGGGGGWCLVNLAVVDLAVGSLAEAKNKE